jgi:hypothetical protein
MTIEEDYEAAMKLAQQYDLESENRTPEEIEADHDNVMRAIALLGAVAALIVITPEAIRFTKSKLRDRRIKKILKEHKKETK